MRNKRTRLLILLFTILVVVSMIALIACENKPTEDPDEPAPSPDRETTFVQYMEKLNAGLKEGQSNLASLKDYHVASEYTLMTREENLTITYEAVYKTNKRDGNYYIKVFDNRNGIDRLTVYYDAADLYVTAGEKHYVINKFGSLLLFDTFASAIDILDTGSYAYGAEMQELFSPNTVLSALIGVKDMSYAKVGENGERVNASGINLESIMGRFNDRFAAYNSIVGTTFDAITDNYLGFRLSRILMFKLKSCRVNEVSFNLTNGMVNAEEIDVRGTIDESKYFLKARYSHDEKTEEIAVAKNLPNAYVYEKVSPGKGSLAGKTTIPELRESDFDFALDYDIVPSDNAENEVTMRIYDDVSTGGDNTGVNKYDQINEIISVYYKDTLAYINTQGAYDFIGTTVALSALRLPKVYLKNFDLSGFLTMVYTDMIRTAENMTSGGTLNVKSKTFEAIVNAVESDVDKKEIKVTVTEDLIKELRGDGKSLMTILAEQTGVEEELLRQYLGDDFFRNMRVVITYNFGTKIATVDIYNGTELLVTTDLYRVENVGVIFPSDLNELNYTEFKEPEIVTVEYEIELNPYGARNVSLSEFIGSFLGDATGKNTPYIITEGRYVVAKGKMSEYYIVDANGKKKAITSLDMEFFLEDKNNKTSTKFMSIVSDSDDLSKVLIELFTPVGDISNESGIAFVMDKDEVARNLETLSENSVFAGQTGLSAFLAIYNAADKNAKTYTDDGFFCVDLMVTEDSDPVEELVGIKNTNARVKCKIGFDPLDLSGVEKEKYSKPYIHEPEDASASGIYASGSKWKETVAVTVSDKRINMYVTYDPESIKIVTGKTEYTPTAKLFGEEFGYSLQIVSTTGTYNVKNVIIDREITAADGTKTPFWVIDPAYYSKTPDTIQVMYEGGEYGTLECEIEGFESGNVTHSGYNLALFAGKTDGIKKYKLVIGKNSIACLEQEIYVGVINRTVKPVTDNDGKELTYVVGNEQIPVVAQFKADPYTYAMTKRVREESGEKYDFLAENIVLQNVTLNFENLYGYESVDEGNGIVQKPLYYDAEGYNYMFLTELGLDWEFVGENAEYFYYGGETRYAVATYGDAENGCGVKIAVLITVEEKKVDRVIIDGSEGTYVMDVLKKETYDIPTTTTSEHTVKIRFADGSERIVSLSRPAAISTDRYCSEYVYGELDWAGRETAKERLKLEGVVGLFGEGMQTVNTTTASFGGVLGMSTQEVTLIVIAPTRNPATTDRFDVTLVGSMSESGEPATPSVVSVNKVRFTAPEGKDDVTEIEYFSINPYNKSARLPDTIWLYLPAGVDTGSSTTKEWVEYPVNWLTTDADGKELNIIKKNDDGYFVLAHPRTEETKLIVYGVVGNSGDAKRQIIISTALLNMESNVKDYVLYRKDGTAQDKDEAVSIDPYLSYEDVLPSRFEAKLGSGETVSGQTEWYYGEFPVYRNSEYGAKYKDARYDKYYGSDGYLLFSRAGGQAELKMTIASGDVRNDIYITVNVSSRTVRSERDGDAKISDYIDIFATGRADGDVYSGTAKAGYTEVSYYTSDSAALYERIAELIRNGGIGAAGFSFIQIDDPKVLYAKEVRWSIERLREVERGLAKKIKTTSFVLTGTINFGTINETQISVLISIDEVTSTVTDMELISGETMTDKGVYTIKNDEDGDGKITLTDGGEGKRLTDIAYYRADIYDEYFGADKVFEYNSFENVLFFSVSEVYRLSKESSGVYCSPSEYFEYLFRSIRLGFTSGKTITANASASISYGGKDAAYFNKNVLGFGEEYSENGVPAGYGFIVLERLSEGSALDRTLVIVAAEKATVDDKQLEDYIDALGEDLNEVYPEKFNLPEKVSVGFRKADGTAYNAFYRVSDWTPYLDYFEDGFGARKSIPANYINIIDGSNYTFSYVLPDMDDANSAYKTFYYNVRFRKKNVRSIYFDGSGQTSSYDISEGKIYVENSYAFLTYDSTAAGDKKYSINLSAIPSVVRMIADAQNYQSGLTDVYSVKWNFLDEEGNPRTSFGEEIFRQGTDENGVLIATFSFDSYYDSSRNKVTQTLELRLVLAPMRFYAIADEKFTVIAHANKGEDELYNTIVIDPYNDVNGYNGNFKLPTTLTLSFNAGQTYKFSNVVYGLVNSQGAYQRDISTIGYNENGHKLTFDYTPDPTWLELRVYVRGYSEEMGRDSGIRINVKFLKRNITDTAMPNSVYRADGTYDYETDVDGKIKYDGDDPVKKTYNSYAKFAFSGSGTKEEGRMPVYFVDPYNSSTFALPTKASFEFASAEAGTYVEYAISGWQYYDYGKAAYVDFEELKDGANPSSFTRFYSTTDGNGRNRRCYFNPSEDSYKGQGYALRGYVSVGDERQYFDVVMVVLNRSLRASAILKDEYKVSYDFIDPIAAMLKDIPELFGDDAFVDYDKYSAKFSVDAKRTSGEGTYRFVLEEGSEFSRKDESGNATNHAVSPEMLWSEEYDTDGDGVPDTLFEQLVEKGFVGTIDGNLYRYDTGITALFGYYELKKDAEYDRLANALVWDTLFLSDGTVSSSYSDAARRAIENEAKELEKEVVYANYLTVAKKVGTEDEIAAGKALSDDDKITLTGAVIDAILQIINAEDQKMYDKNDEEDMKYIAYRTYLATKESYDEWTVSGGNKTVRVRIYEAWTSCIKDYRAADVQTSGNVSANQKLKAEHFLKVYNKEGALNTAEKAALDAKKKTIASSLYVNKNSALWDEVYAAANPAERKAMDKYEEEYRTTGDDGRSGKSMASDLFRKDVKGMSSLGTKGEKAEADVSIPVIRYSSIEVTGGGTTIRFNKFNFQSIDKTFTVRFELSYEEIYKRMLEEAEEAVRSSYREEQKGEVLSEYEIRAIKDAVNAIAPKKADADGNYSVIDGLKTKAGKAFDYDMWIKGGDKASYASFWNALVKYYSDSAISIITSNVGELRSADGYDDVKDNLAFKVSVPEWNAVVSAFKEVKILSMADGIIADAKNRYDFENSDERRQAVRYLATIVAEELNVTITDAYIKLGLSGTYATDYEYEVTSEMWNTVSVKFRSEAYREIALAKLSYIEKNNDTDEEVGRNKAVRDLAVYLVENDVNVSKLEEVRNAAEKEKRATTLAQTLLVTTSADEGLKQAARSAASEAGSNELEVGYAVLFSYSYPATVTDVMYDLLEKTFGQSNEAFVNLCDRHSTKLKKKAIVAFLARVSEDTELRKAAETYFTFLTRYAKGKTSPYGVMMNNPTGAGYGAARIETLQNGLPAANCLLYYAEPDAVYLDALKSEASAIGMTENEITVALKRMKLYDTLYARASQQEKDNYYAAYESESSYVTGNEAMERLFSALENNGESGKEIKKSLVSFYDKETQAQNNLSYYAFIELVSQAEEKGRTEGKAYRTFVEEYVSENEYTKAKELLDEIKKNYESSKAQSDSSVTGRGYIAKNYYGDYFEKGGYLTINDYSDDYHDTEYLKEELIAIIEAKGLSYGDSALNSITEAYMKDTLLRAIAAYYETADAASKATVEEVAATFTGSRISGDAETEFVTLAAASKLPGQLGVKIYDALKARGDFGSDEISKIEARFYFVWLNEARGAATRKIKSTKTSQIEGNATYSAEITRLTGLMNSLSGKAESAPLEGETLVSAKEIATAKILAQMLTAAESSCIAYEDAYEKAVRSALEGAAKTYAYDRMYELKSESGNYVYRAVLEEITDEKTTEAAEGAGKAAFDERKFNEAEQAMLAEKLSTAKNAIGLAVKTALYAKAYDKIKLFGLNANEFAYKLYVYLTGSTSANAAQELFGENLNGADGIIGRTLAEYAKGQEIDVTSEAYDTVRRLTDWWKANTEAASVYGVLGEEERAFIEQIYRQAYYQANALAGGTLTSTSGAEVAYATMTTSIYLFLADKDDAENDVPADYFSAGNEDEYKAYIVDLMLSGDLLNRKGHALTLAAARLNTVVTELALAEGKLLCEYTGIGSVTGSANFDEIVSAMTNVLMKASGVVKSGALTEEEIAEREAFYLGYLEKAVNYVEYTSVYGSEEYAHTGEMLVNNPLRNYTDKIYVKVTGKNLYGTSRTSEELESEFGMLSFGKYLEKAGGDYTKALEMMTETRIIEVKDFVSEDHAESGDVHVIYFDRKEWDETLASNGATKSNPYYDNRNVFIANDGKTYRIIDVGGGYGYANALKASGLRYELSDFTEIDLFFDADESNPYNEPTRVNEKGETVIDDSDPVKYARAMETNEKKNVLMLDALAPELPDKAYAIGYVKTGAAIDYSAGIKLGEVDITGYSEEFNKLVYKGVAAKADDAYVITVREASGTSYKKQGDIRVGYLDRNVEKIYLETDAYLKGRAKPETSGDFAGRYSLFDDTTGSITNGKNVIYVDPTDENVVLSASKSYALPSEMAVKCGEGEKIEFTDVVWDMKKVKYGLGGTGEAGIEMRVLEYRYVDENGNTRKISYDYDKYAVTMTTYDKSTGEEKGTATYVLSKDDMIDWNTVLVIEDQSLQAIVDAESGVQIADATSVNEADATAHSLEINPYYPEYPENIQLTLANESVNVELSQSDWTPNLTKLNNIRRGAATDYTFDASFYYLGYEIKVLFKAMKITVPIGEMLDGGTIYLMRDGGDFGTQFKRNYGEMYFNFAENEESKPNWQKVPVALKDANKISRTETGIQEVYAVIGSTSVTAGIAPNVTFRLKLIDLKNYAEYDGGYNNFVHYDYYSIPSDGSKKATGTGESPAAMGSTFLYVDGNGEKTAFNAESDDISYDFIGKIVTVYATYGTADSDNRLACDSVGTQKRGLYFTVPMESYDRSSVTDVEFVTDETGKKWTWTKKSKTSPDYVDAIYWKIGTAMKASDLPTVKDRITGTEVKLDWDLSGLNVNRANVEEPNAATATDGVEILGYYMVKNGVWQSVRLRVYIEKINVTDKIIGFTKADGTKNEGTNIEKEYDSQYYELPFNAESDEMKFLREDGTHEVIPAENYVVEYMKAGSDVWSDETLPLDAGTYYIRVRLRTDDYNVYIEYENDRLFTLTVKPYEVDMSKIKFDGEDANGAISVVYGAENVFGVTSGLPAFTPAGWFAAGEKARLYNGYVQSGMTEEGAKAAVYAVIYNRVADRTKETLDGWYREGKANFGYDRIDKEQDVKIKAWIYDSKMDASISLVEVKVKYTYYYGTERLDYVPTDCGNYTVKINLDDENGNYAEGEKTKNVTLRIERDENIRYAFADTNLVYNGNVQNPEISGLHKDGTVPYGVKVTYRYVIAGKLLVVVIEGVKDASGNVVNKVTVDSANTTVTNPTSGIKNAGAYVCSVEIDGGNNYPDGTINDQPIGISAAKVFIDMAEIKAKYLSEEEDLSKYVKVYDEDGNEQEEGVLLGGDKLADLGVLRLSAADAEGITFGSYFKVGTYYTFIDGLASSAAASATYTEFDGAQYGFNGYIYSKLSLKSFDKEGSLYKDADGNEAVISLFGNYNIFVRTHEFTDGVKAAGIYKVEGEDGSDGVSSNAELQDYIANLKDGDYKIVYLSSLMDADGNVTAYDPIVIDKSVRLKIVGYAKSGEGSEVDVGRIETKIKGIRVLKGIVELRIISIESDESGKSALYVGDGAGSVSMYNCRITKSGAAANVTGVETSINYKGSVYAEKTVIDGVSRAITLAGGSLEIRESTIERNFDGIVITTSGKVVNVTETTFGNNMGTAITSVTGDITVRRCRFEYNGTSLDLPTGSPLRTDVNNANVYENNGDDDLYD